MNGPPDALLVGQPPARLETAEPKEVKPPERLSATTLRAAAQCVLSSYFSREAGNPSSEPSVLGTVAHEVASQVAFQARLAEKETYDPDEVERIAWRVLMRPERPNPLSQESMDEIIRLMRKWATTVSFPVKAEVFETEMLVDNVIDGERFSGRIDQLSIDGSFAEIEDLKTGRLTPSQAAFEASPQLITYAVHVSEMYPDVDTFALRENYCRTGTIRETVVTREDVEHHRRWMTTVAARMRAAWAAREFPPTPGAHCRFCVSPHLCPLPEAARPESLDSPEGAKAEVGAILVEEARLKKRKKALRAFLERQYDEDDEPAGVELGDAHAYLDVIETTRFSRKDAEADGLDLSPYDKPSTTRKLVVG